MQSPDTTVAASSRTTPRTTPWTTIARDLAALAKPRITLMVILTAAGGLALAPGRVPTLMILLTLVATAMVVASANALNCWLERDVDKHMARTKRRPLPSGRMAPRLALAFGLGLGIVSVPMLIWVANPLTGLLGAAALVSYVWIYTPMKQRSPAALIVGAVPGAMPPLMGWTAASEIVTFADLAPGLVLFGILFLWQMPHFIAISIFRQEEYSKAGIKVLPAVRGNAVAKIHAVFYAAALLPVSLLLVPLGIAGTGYLVAAALLGSAYLGMSVWACDARPETGGPGSCSCSLWPTCRSCSPRSRSTSPSRDDPMRPVRVRTTRRCTMPLHTMPLHAMAMNAMPMHAAWMYAALMCLPLAGCGDTGEPPLPEMVPISDFTLTDQDGADFGTAQLAGKVWIADLIFTSCPSICPMMSTQMGNLHRRIDDPRVAFVSISVDPEVDRPEVLRAYAERYRADTDRWHFLTGTLEDVNRVVHLSFRLPMGDRMDREDGQYDILHTGRFILIDQRATMRGLYETNRAGQDQLEHDVQRLLDEAG